MKAPERPLLVYDGDCDFCRRWIARWRARTGDRVEIAPFQEVADRFPEIERRRFAEAVHLRDENGAWTRGAEAVFRSLALAPGSGLWLGLYRHLPGFAALTEAAYRLVARRRPLFTAITRMLWGEHVVPPGERLTSWIFLRALGVVTVIAFVSLWAQIAGLVGEGGILPAREFLDSVAKGNGAIRFWWLPTFCWFDASNASLHLQCALGVASGVTLAIGALPAASLAIAWALYLSLATVCRDFLWFQWDGLLLETLFLSLFLAPRRLWSRPASDPTPSRLGLWLLRWLLFRLMVSSALVKLASGDPAWRDLTALQYHYETQCLPPWTAWYAHHLPAAFHRASAAALFAIEGLAPWLVFAPRRLRFLGAGLIAGLQLLILATGNYGFFNLLVLALCVPWLDDAVWPGRRATDSAPAPRHASRMARLAALALVLVSLAPTFRGAGWVALAAPLLPAYVAIAPLRVVNAYGLFAVMTRRRDEIVIAGSDDGVAWRAYEFPWKPGDPRRRPGIATPHMPRLDWLMWFAALDQTIDEPWLEGLAERLLRDSKPVVRLLAVDPFAGHAPRYVRASFWRYRFTTPAERRAGRAWWSLSRLGAGRTWTLADGRLVEVRTAARPSRPLPGHGLP